LREERIALPRKTEKDEIKEKLEYLGLDFDNIPKSLKNFESLQYRVTKGYDENKHKQYRYISIKDVEILLSPTNRLSDLEEKYAKASPIYSYLVPENEEDILKHTTFLSMLKNMNIEEIEKIEEEQKQLNKEIPFKVKYPKNYLWQIYYSENTNRYFMIVPTEEADNSAFFYLLKKQLEKRRIGKIFVPINNVEYTNKLFKKLQYEEIENYLWLFTKDWPYVYEVYDKKDEVSIHIVGETEVYGKIRSAYKVELKDESQCNRFYKLLKALFILQTELPYYYSFETNIDSQGGLEFYFEGKKIEYGKIATFLREQCARIEKESAHMQADIEELNRKLKILQTTAVELEMEYLAKEKQISTFLECKKSFFGKVKYFFKYNKKSKDKEMKKKIEDIKNDINDVEDELDKAEEDETIDDIEIGKSKKQNYTIEELIEKAKKSYEIENQKKNLVMDINALKLKNKNMAKKIENAALYIEEIDNHKKSIFEFWKYSNKDEVSALAEGEAEEFNVRKKISKTFDYNQDIKTLGEDLDRLQRKELSKDELDSVYIATTNVIDILNKIKVNKATPKDIEMSLRELKEDAKKEKSLLEKEDFDIFGGRDANRMKILANKKHREFPRDRFKILDISSDTNQLEFKMTLEQVVEKIQSAISKTSITEDVPIYKAISMNKLNRNMINLFDINPEKEMQNAINQEGVAINLYKINLVRNTKAVACTNIVFYDNQNRTLPEGMDLSTKVLFDLEQEDLELKEQRMFKVVLAPEDEEIKDVQIKTVNVFEYDVKELEEDSFEEEQQDELQPEENVKTVQELDQEKEEYYDEDDDE